MLTTDAIPKFSLTSLPVILCFSIIIQAETGDVAMDHKHLQIMSWKKASWVWLGVSLWMEGEMKGTGRGGSLGIRCFFHLEEEILMTKKCSRRNNSQGFGVLFPKHPKSHLGTGERQIPGDLVMCRACSPDSVALCFVNFEAAFTACRQKCGLFVRFYFI